MRKFTKAFIGSTLLSLSVVSNAVALELTEVSAERIEKPEVKQAEKQTAAPVKAVKTEAPEVRRESVPQAESVQVSGNEEKAKPAAAPEAAAEKTPSRKVSYVAYVSDESSVWATRGPGKQYKLSGQIKIGERVEVLSEKNDYVEVRTPKDTIVWIPKREIQREKSNRYKVSKLEEENSSLKYKLDNIDSESMRELKKATEELTRLKKAYTELKQVHEEMEVKMKETAEENEELSSKLETKDQDMQLRWWKQGGLIALIGAIVGVILVYLPRPRRRKDDYYY